MIRDACYLDSIIAFALYSAEFCNTIYPKADIEVCHPQGFLLWLGY